MQYLTARLTLFSLEAKDAGANVGIALALIGGGLIVALIGYVLVVMTIVFGIAAAVGGRYVWIFVMGGAALVHLLLAAAFVSRARRRLRGAAFHTTLEELRKDREWLTNLAKNR